MNNINIELTKVQKDVLKCNLNPHQCEKCSFEDCNKESFNNVLWEVYKKLDQI